MTDYEALLTSVLTGRIPVSEGERGLTAFAIHDFHSNPAYLHFRTPRTERVLLTPEDVRRSLNRYLAGETAADELRDWAQFLVMVPSYSGPEPPADDEDWFDDMWDVLHHLATPGIFEPINPVEVRAKLALLDRYVDAGAV
jgi:hypothetical protein